MRDTRRTRFRGATVTLSAWLPALLWMLVGCSSVQQAAQDPLVEVSRGNYEVAISALEKRLTQAPGDEAALGGLARAYIETGKYAEAEAIARKFLQSNRSSAAAHFALGESLAATGKYRDAVEEYRQAATNTKGSLKIRAELRQGEMLDIVGDRVAADKLFESVVEAYEAEEKSTAETETAAALALTHLERFKEANEVVLNAIDTDKGYLEAHLTGGELFTTKYQYAEAAEFFRDALALNKNSARAPSWRCPQSTHPGSRRDTHCTDTRTRDQPELCRCQGSRSFARSRGRVFLER